VRRGGRAAGQGACKAREDEQQGCVAAGAEACGVGRAHAQMWATTFLL
jgi:hypothetical protein